MYELNLKFTLSLIVRKGKPFENHYNNITIIIFIIVKS
jgi:hypothetical protein